MVGVKERQRSKIRKGFAGEMLSGGKLEQLLLRVWDLCWSPLRLM